MRITYYGDGKGRWVKREWAKQCSHDFLLFVKRCQGKEGHSGDHWGYAEDGSYVWSINDNEPRPDDYIAGGITPPGHKNWVSPVDKCHEKHTSFHQDTEVTDPALIDKLNNGYVEDGASIDQPCSDEEVQWLRDNGYLDCLKGKDEQHQRDQTGEAELGDSL